jgi:L-gulonate 3-dehydrogenase
MMPRIARAGISATGELKMADKIAIVATGLVGRAWSIVFARAGYDTVMYDPIDGVANNALELIGESLVDLHAADLLRGRSTHDVLSHLRVADTLAEAVDGCVHVQESGPERVEIKRELYAELDRCADPQTVLASSTSGIPSSQFTEQLRNRQRCLVAHPINPPHIIPLVEIVPAPWTEANIVERTRSLMSTVGQCPIGTTREINGFVVNRLQGALLAEAFKLVEDGVCTVADIDSAIADGLGLRWSFIGPFETIDLNSPTGIKGYCDMLSPLYYDLAREQADPRPWTEPLVHEIERQRRELLPIEQLGQRQQWRDRRLAKLVGHKRRLQTQDAQS